MKKFLIVFVLLTIKYVGYGNDGSFYASGNQLIPINETDIQLKKEILTLKKIGTDYVEVSVYYELFNPTKEKSIIVGFEASSPYGDVNGMPKNGLHPYMKDFTVELNGTILPYEVAYVEDSVYVKNGIIKGKPFSEIRKSIEDEQIVGFNYVYHFKSTFKPGKNIIKHTYRYKLSSGVAQFYEVPYVLTAAKRWANKQIDDFTMIIDMGEFESFIADKTFFKDAKGWTIAGIGKMKDIKANEDRYEMDGLNFFVQKGIVIYHAQNFKPAGELHLYSERNWQDPDYFIPFSYNQQNEIAEPKNDFERKVMKNLPFARRGYVFKDVELKQFYEKIDWYIPNPNYVPDVQDLTPVEKEWINKWK